MGNTGQAVPPKVMTDIDNQSQHSSQLSPNVPQMVSSDSTVGTRTNQLELVQRIKHICYSGYWIYIHPLMLHKTWFGS
jgi:hypothetical protein